MEQSAKIKRDPPEIHRSEFLQNTHQLLLSRNFFLDTSVFPYVIFVQGGHGAKQELSVHHARPPFDERAEDTTESGAYLHHGG